MGSGSSKDKDTPVQTSRTSQSEVRKSEPLPTKEKNENKSKTNERIEDYPLKHSEFGRKQQNGNTKKLDKNENNNKTKGRIPEPFDDSDDEDDILSDKWKNKKNATNGGYNGYSNNRTNTWQPPEPPKEDYPETYAQKMQREQYKQEQLLRQKTIYRDPEEWDISDQASQQSFDVNRFKEANRVMPKTDIFGPLSNNDYSYRHHDSENDNYYQTSNHARKKSVPRYDVTEEELMADIETHYY